MAGVKEALFGALPSGGNEKKGVLFGDASTGIGGFAGSGMSMANSIVGLTNTSDKKKGKMGVASGVVNTVSSAQAIGNFVNTDDKSASDWFGLGGSIAGGASSITDIIGGAMSMHGNTTGAGIAGGIGGIIGALGGASAAIGGGINMVKGLRKDQHGRRDWKGALRGGLGMLSGLAGVAGGISGAVGGFSQASGKKDDKGKFIGNAMADRASGYSNAASAGLGGVGSLMDIFGFGGEDKSRRVFNRPRTPVPRTPVPRTVVPSTLTTKQKIKNAFGL